ncbi:DNA repair protein RecN [Ostreibacterium oceani]|uniref:DNA repair protein RecN n=1 Tax=Ostreibacterium oceani TaxID=2654998 RepID=A0A6N7EYA1_9GAMM|nr:DNA repair protein RecN [Ostreibacterium oceani]MPV85458.1 DNA repair protein RecN [Ostreibacterium oceani]
MLSQLFLKNFAIVDEQTVTFAPGLNVLSGETGAGKSILIDALGLQLGDRADATWIRHGATRADIQASLTLSPSSAAYQWLLAHELLDDELLGDELLGDELLGDELLGDELLGGAASVDSVCHLRRTLNRNGKSQCYINGIPVTVGMTKHLGELLVDIHGQHAHQSLTAPEQQRQLLDGFAVHHDLLTQTQTAYATWQQLEKRKTQLQDNDQSLIDKKNLLDYQLDELTALNLQPDEFEALESQQKQLASASARLDLSQQLQQHFEGEGEGLLAVLQRANTLCDKLQATDDDAQEIADFIAQTRIYADEANSALAHYINRIELDPAQLAEVESRMSALHQLARKHHTSPDALLDLTQAIADERDALTQSLLQLQDIDKQIAEAEKQYRQAAQALSDSRQLAAKQLAQQVNARLDELNLVNAVFDITISATRATASGVDNVLFMFAPNPGQAAKPLHKIASGGELSRISLAIQVASVSQKTDATLIFDEVDSGIGGATAEVVGRLLKTLAQYNQILCVTHLAQVAAYADNHILISKQVNDAMTTTHFAYLDEAQKIAELARMSGGIAMDEKTLEHAQHLRQNALQFKP